MVHIGQIIHKLHTNYTTVREFDVFYVCVHKVDSNNTQNHHRLLQKLNNAVIFSVISGLVVHGWLAAFEPPGCQFSSLATLCRACRCAVKPLGGAVMLCYARLIPAGANPGIIS